MASAFFSVANFIAVVSWVLLAAFPARRWAELVTSRVVPVLLASAYAVIIATTWGRIPGGFSSLAAVGQLFENPWMRLAGWLHYLAFDLLVGGSIVRDARERGIRHGWIVPLLFLTFMFGPAGWLAYRGVELVAVKTRDRPLTS
jgi:hypothetical protein